MWVIRRRQNTVVFTCRVETLLHCTKRSNVSIWLNLCVTKFVISQCTSLKIALDKPFLHRFNACFQVSTVYHAISEPMVTWPCSVSFASLYRSIANLRFYKFVTFTADLCDLKLQRYMPMNFQTNASLFKVKFIEIWTCYTCAPVEINF